MFCPVCLNVRTSAEDMVSIQENGYCSSCVRMTHDFDCPLSESEAIAEGLTIINPEELYGDA